MDKNDIYLKSASLIAKKLGKPIEEIVLTPKETHDAILEHYKTPQSRNTIVTGVWMFVKKMHEDGKLPDDTYNEWRKIRVDTQTIVSDIYESNKATDRQVKGYVKLEEIIKVRDKLPVGPQKLLLAMYTYVPPVRNDYHQLRIYHSQPDEPKGNYIVLGDVNRMYLHEFKTAHRYKKVEIELPKELVKLIMKSLKIHPREYVFLQKNGQPYASEKTFDAWANYNLKKVLNNDHVTLTMLRHIYITDKCSGVMTFKERKNISTVMAHSVEMQLKYAFNKIGNSWKN